MRTLQPFVGTRVPEEDLGKLVSTIAERVAKMHPYQDYWRQMPCVEQSSQLGTARTAAKKERTRCNIWCADTSRVHGFGSKCVVVACNDCDRAQQRVEWRNVADDCSASVPAIGLPLNLVADGAPPIFDSIKPGAGQNALELKGLQCPPHSSFDSTTLRAMTREGGFSTR